MATKTTPPVAPPSSSNRFFAWMRSLNIQREPGWIGGVASGIATRIGIDPLIVRGIIVVVAILGGPALLVYAAAWLLLPDLDDRIHLERVLKGEVEAPIAGIGLLVLLSLLPVSQGFWFAGSALWGEPYWGAALGRALWTLLILGLAVWLVVWIVRRPGVIPTAKSPSAPPAPPANAPAAEFAAWREQQAAWKTENLAFRQQANAERAAAFRTIHEEQRTLLASRQAIVRERNRRSRPNPLFSILVVGLALTAGGFTILYLKSAELDVTDVIAGLSVALAVLALGMIINGVRGKRAGGAAGLAGLIVIPLVLFTWFPQNTHFQYSSAYFAPQNDAGTTDDFYLAGGRGGVVLDLEDYYEDGRSLRDDFESDGVFLLVVSGNVEVHLPDDAYTVVDATTLSGGVQVSDGDDEYGYDTRGRSSSIRFNDDEALSSELHVHILVLNGTVTITDPEGNS